VIPPASTKGINEIDHLHVFNKEFSSFPLVVGVHDM